MTDDSVAVLHRSEAKVEEALSRAADCWNDSRCDSTMDRYLRPFSDADDLLRTHIISLLVASDQARVDSGKAHLAAAMVDAERLQAQEDMLRVRGQMAEAEAAIRAALDAAEVAARVHAGAIRLAEEANTTAP